MSGPLFLVAIASSPLGLLDMSAGGPLCRPRGTDATSKPEKRINFMMIDNKVTGLIYPNTSQLDSIRQRAREASSNALTGLKREDQFSRNRGELNELYGMGTANLTRRAPDGCYQCNTTTCGGVTCGKTC